MSCADSTRGQGELTSIEALAAVVADLSHLLPAQGPIGVFVHHNPLHAFEQLPFETAAIEAGRRFGCAPFMSEEAYRAAMAAGRMTEVDVDAVLRAELGHRADERVAGIWSRLQLWRLMALHGVPVAQRQALDWLLAETDELTCGRQDWLKGSSAGPTQRRHEATAGRADSARGVAGGACRMPDLWSACVRAVKRAGPLSQTGSTQVTGRHRDAVLEACGVDCDEWIHPLLIRFLAAYLDQGLAYWPLPGREEGLYQCFLQLYGGRLATLCGPWARTLPAVVRREQAKGHAAIASLQQSLGLLGVAASDWSDYLAQTLLALPGWAGMIRQLEQRPDRVPKQAVAARLVDYLAVRLLLERCALRHAMCAHLGLADSLSDLRPILASRRPSEPAARPEERAWALFQLVRLTGADAEAIDRLDLHDVASLEAELCDFDGLARRRVLHLAYERYLRQRFYEALVQPPASAQKQPHVDYQALFCVDEREESIRRHLEESDASAETFGVPGYFDVAIYFRGVADAHPRPLCPVSVRPEHYLEELRPPTSGWRARWRALRQQGSGFLAAQIYVASRTLVRGTLLMATLGVASMLPLVLRVLFPWFRQRLRADAARSISTLQVERRASQPPLGRYAGFTTEEMADIVWRQLRGLGLADRMAPLVLIVGHRSTSLNNPHESAHDCGACGGGPGGANARAFAYMANHPTVRELVAERGLLIPATSWFVAAERNTASSAIRYFDDELIPAALRPLFARAKASLDRARAREAHERCRRFEAASLSLSPRDALLHVESRAADLAQPRPEYGHASNAFCLIGRRQRTRGLFLDRRAFLVSYDPREDPEGLVLEDLVSSVVPVVAGISLEYYFGYVDPTGYGSGTKLPHNVACLLGVMDGAQSDLRTGLPWQMLEIHEPVRMTLVVEAQREVMLRLLEQSAVLSRLARNRWLFLARLDPDNNHLEELTPEGFAPCQIEHSASIVRGRSIDCYRGKREHLPLSWLDPTERQEMGRAS